MSDFTIKNSGAMHYLTLPYYWARVLLSRSGIEKDILQQLQIEQDRNKEDNPFFRNTITSDTGSCEVIVLQNVLCREGISANECRRIINTAKEKNPSIWGNFRQGGRCS